MHMAIIASFVAQLLAASEARGPAPSKDGWKPLFNGRDLSGWETFLRPASDDPAGPGRLDDDRDGVFSVVTFEGQPAIRISGQHWGTLTTKEEFGDFHLKAEFKWGVKKWPPRENRTRDSGIIYRATGPHGGGEKGGVWMEAPEFQIEEGMMGDFIGVLRVVGDITAVPREATNPNQRLIYTPGAKPLVGIRRAVASEHVEKSTEWNQVELTADGAHATHKVNGRVVLEVSNLRREISGGRPEPVLRGRLQIQSEGAEVFYRNIYIRRSRRLPKSPVR